MTENETQEPTKRNTACEVRMYGENNRPTGSRGFASQSKARAWLKTEDAPVGRFEIIRVIAQGMTTEQKTRSIEPLPNSAGEARSQAGLTPETEEEGD